MRRWVGIGALGTAVILAGCARPITQVGSVSQIDVEAERQEQLRLAAEVALANQRRVERLAAPLIDAAAPLCGRSTKPHQGTTSKNRLVQATAVCPFKIIVEQGDNLNAKADGSRVSIETGMLRFASDDELSVVLAHEIAHNAMRHRDAKMKNMLGGALLGAVVDAVVDARGGYSGGRMTKAGAEAGAQAFSQDFEREADYVGLYILAWAGRPVENAAGFWRRMAVEHPTGIVFATTHPTTAERFVRLEEWAREVNRKLASGDAFGPETKDRRLQVASRPVTEPKRSVSAGDVTLAAAPTISSPALGTDAGSKPALSPNPAPTIGSASKAAPEKVPSRPVPIAPLPDDERYARATIGAPRSESDRESAVPAYRRGMEHLGAQRWSLAKAQFKEALRLDGSVAAYHAALGEVLLIEEDWAGAAAEYTAALLVDVDNHEYRARLKEARSRK
jgi:Zn-dependent protease with chaperone function